MKLCSASYVLLVFIMVIHDINSLIISRGKCLPPVLMNGRVRVMSRGRTARFRCDQTFQLFGEKYATCLRGNWDTVPICVKSGCVSLPFLKNGQIVESYRGAVVKFLCNPGYASFGSSFMYCNGAVWNGTIPECRASEKMVQTLCDFESQDLCGWTQDPHHNFDWSRQNFQTPSGNVGTGPSFDHTLGPGRGGYYMFIESSSPRLENDTARLYSPVFTSQFTTSQPSCFIFWYHMYGATTGSLHVYTKPENTEFSAALLPRFIKSGDQGNQWHQAIVLLPSMNEPFQVIIEAVRGAGYVSDIAIDDVKIANGSECLASVTRVPSPTESVNQNGGGNEIYESTQSCRLRCTSTNIALTRTTAIASETPVFAECECHVGCLRMATCCPDYASYCMFVSVPWAATKSAIVNRPYHTPPPLPPLPPYPSAGFPALPSSTQNSLIFEISSDLPKPLESTEVHRPVLPPWTQDGLKYHLSSTTELNRRIPIPTDPTPLILQPPTAVYIPKKPPVIPQIDKPPIILTTLKPITTSIASHSTMSPFTFSQRLNPVMTELNETAFTKPINTLSINTSSTASTTLKRPILPIRRNSSSATTTLLVPQKSATTPATQKYPTVVQLTSKPVVASIPPVTELKQTSRTSEPTVSPLIILQSTTVPTETQSFTEQLKHSEAVTRQPWMKVTRDQKWIEARRGPDPRQKYILSQSGIVGILVAVMLVITAVAIASYFVVRNRRRVHRQQQMADDSDVRFLTSDEALDFSLARPVDNSDDYL